MVFPYFRTSVHRSSWRKIVVGVMLQYEQPAFSQQAGTKYQIREVPGYSVSG